MQFLDIVPKFAIVRVWYGSAVLVKPNLDQVVGNVSLELPTNVHNVDAENYSGGLNGAKCWQKLTHKSKALSGK